MSDGHDHDGGVHHITNVRRRRLSCGPARWALLVERALFRPTPSTQ